MKQHLKNTIALSLLPQIIVVKWLSYHPEWVEVYYSKGFYVAISKFFRILYGWIPFSVGDILYASLIILALRYVIIKRKYIRQKPFNFIRNCGVVLAVAYFTFHISWGLNYYREPLSKALQLKETQSRESLVVFVEKLIKKTNLTQVAITGDSTQRVQIPYTNQEIFKKTIAGYHTLQKIHPSLAYEQASLKESLLSTPLSYMGYGGYLNPFTNEAQVNALIPPFRFPVVSGHEVGHQLGYSAENETNLIGYLVTVHNEDIYFKYAAYAYALSYCLSDIKENDEATFNRLFPKLNSGVKENYQELNTFWQQFENVTEPIFKSVFNTFLKANHQDDGIKSYSRVVLLLVSYYQKYPL